MRPPAAGYLSSMEPAREDDRGTWDLVVVGAGPAGAAAALGALRTRPGLRVLLLDRADFPRDKCCGDGIAPHALDVLRSRGRRRTWPRAGRRCAGWSCPATATTSPVAWPGRSGSSRARSSTPAWWTTPWPPAPCSAPGGCARCSRVGNRVELDDGTRTRVVVGADGAHSTVRSCLAAGPPGRRALAIRGYAPTPPGRRGRQVIRYGDRRQPSYAWAFDRGDGLPTSGTASSSAAPPLPTRPGPPAPSCSSSWSGCSPARSRTATAGARTTCRCRAGAGTTRTGGCC